MKKSQRLVKGLTVAILAAAVLTGCGSKEAGQEANATGTSEAAATQASGETTFETSKAATDETNEAAADETGETTIKVGGNITPHTEILYEAQKILKEEGVNLEVVEIEDSVTPNTSLVEGSIDANYFQHVPYMEEYNAQNNTDLVSIGAIHYEPFGVYSAKYKSLSELPDDAVIAVPNNVTNEARALLLLEQEGILKLKEGVGVSAAVTDVVENPKNITFNELDPAQLAKVLPDVDAAVINGNYALEGGLKISDALAKEASDSIAAQTYGNIIATTKEKENDENLKKLVEVLKSDEIKKFINDTYEGAVVPLD